MVSITGSGGHHLGHWQAVVEKPVLGTYCIGRVTMRAGGFTPLLKPWRTTVAQRGDRAQSMKKQNRDSISFH